MNANTESGRRVPELWVEKLALGELDAVRAATVRAQLEAEPGGVERLAAIETGNARDLARYPVEDVLAEARRRLDNADRVRAALAESQAGEKSTWRGWWALAPTLAAVALVFLVLRPDGPAADGGLDPNLGVRPGAGASHAPDGTRAKGDPARLLVHRKTDRGSEPLEPGAPASPGDLLQIGYLAVAPAYGVIVSLDGRGQVTPHLPERGDRAVALQSGQKVPLPHSYELDDAPNFERFVLVYASRAFPVDEVLQAARRLAADANAAAGADLPLPEGLHQVSFLVKKVQP